MMQTDAGESQFHSRTKSTNLLVTMHSQFLQMRLLPFAIRALLPALMLVLATRVAFAHTPGLSTATVRLEADRMEAVLVFSTVDAGELVDLDKNRDGQISKDESEAGVAELQTMAAQALDV